MERISIGKVHTKQKSRVHVSGWVHARRDHGKIIFIDLRDDSGLLQLVFSPDKEEAYRIGESLRPEWVVKVEGTVAKRPEGMKNPKIPTGGIELSVERAVVLNEAKIPPFEIAEEKEVNEELRLKYRYLDLRRERMKKNIVFRHRVVKYIRDFLDKKGFLEVETPILTKSTPEGARDFLVPSRTHPGMFFALPQSPQQLKQLLMVGGIEKYFQIARCFRDEDTRRDRSPEFTQLDIEMAFVSREEALNLFEGLVAGIIEELTEKKFTEKPFPRISHKDAVEKYHTDKPDLRKNTSDPNELAFCWVINWPLFEWNKEENRWDPAHHIFTSPREEDLVLLEKDPGGVKSLQYDLVLNGHEIAGGSIRNHRRDVQNIVFTLAGITQKEIDEKFGHLLTAFDYGAPPHGGIAMGIDRFLMILLGESSLRETIAFPKMGDGSDLMMGAPSSVEPKQLKDLGIKLEM